MLQLSHALPSLRRLNDVPGNDGNLAVLQSWPELEGAVKQRKPLTLFMGATGCGKSKYIPDMFFVILSTLASMEKIACPHNSCQRCRGHASPLRHFIALPHWRKEDRWVCVERRLYYFLYSGAVFQVVRERRYECFE